jgi:hypothetical protein
VSDGRKKKPRSERREKKTRRQRTNKQKNQRRKHEKKKPLEREESPGNKHRERTREQPRRTNQNCRTVSPLFLLKETEERVRTREDRDTKKPGGKQRG